MLPANGPTPPTTATITPSQARDHAAPDGGQAEQRHDDPADAVHPPEHGHDRLAVGDRRPQQHAVDDRVRVGARSGGRARRSSRLMPASPPSGAAPGRRRPRASRRGRRGHHACSSCSASRVTSTPAGSHASPTSIASRLGSDTSASTVSRSGVTDHSSSSSRPSVSTGSSPTSTAPPAPSAQRPAHEATHVARRPASQRPSAVARHAQRGERRRGVVAHEPQRPAHRLQLELEPAVPRRW